MGGIIVDTTSQIAQAQRDNPNGEMNAQGAREVVVAQLTAPRGHTAGSFSIEMTRGIQRTGKDM